MARRGACTVRGISVETSGFPVNTVQYTLVLRPFTPLPLLSSPPSGPGLPLSILCTNRLQKGQAAS